MMVVHFLTTILKMKKMEYNKLDNSLASFEFIKQKSEKYWESIDLEICWGFQIQEGSKWKEGLSEGQINDFQNDLKIQFPESLKNYFRTMNGLDKPGINNNGGEHETEYGPIFYSYPEDVEKIKSQIEWILQENHAENDNSMLHIPTIFPFLGHRFLILDEEEIVLSMFGTDIIYWAENLSKGVASDIFTYHPKMSLKKVNTKSFWNMKVT
jgi:hypothetical protein